MPSISERFRPASDIASSAALLIRSSEDEPSCLPNAVRPTPVMKLMAVRCRAVRHSGMVPTGRRFAPPDDRLRTRPGISRFRVRIFDAPRNDGLKSQSAYFKTPLIRLRQAQHLLGNKTENELRADRGDARDQEFTQIALDVVFPGVAEAAVRHDGLLAGLKTGFGREIFRGVGRRPTWQALIILPARRQRHQPRGFELHP